MIYEMTVQVHDERRRLVDHLNVEPFEIFEREEVPVRATFSDHWGNRLGLFEYKDEEAAKEKLQQAVRR